MVERYNARVKHFDKTGTTAGFVETSPSVNKETGEANETEQAKLDNQIARWKTEAANSNAPRAFLQNAITKKIKKAGLEATDELLNHILGDK